MEETGVGGVGDDVGISCGEAEGLVGFEAEAGLGDGGGGVAAVEVGDKGVGAVVEAAVGLEGAVDAVDAAGGGVVFEGAFEISEVEVVGVAEAGGGAFGEVIVGDPEPPPFIFAAQSAHELMSAPGGRGREFMVDGHVGGRESAEADHAEFIWFRIDTGPVLFPR